MRAVPPCFAASSSCQLTGFHNPARFTAIDLAALPDRSRSQRARPAFGSLWERVRGRAHHRRRAALTADRLSGRPWGQGPAGGMAINPGLPTVIFARCDYKSPRPGHRGDRGCAPTRAKEKGGQRCGSDSWPSTRFPSLAARSRRPSTSRARSSRRGRNAALPSPSRVLEPIPCPLGDPAVRSYSRIARKSQSADQD